MTELVYLQDTYRLEHPATVTAVTDGPEGALVLSLTSTVFHPQGGGQPSDTGTICAGDAQFCVTNVKLDPAGVVLHHGHMEQGRLEEGMEVHCRVDRAHRLLNARNHTAGHLLDTAMLRLGPDVVGAALVPAKGYHFPDSPYVEYVGKVDVSRREAFVERLNAELAGLIEGGVAVQVHNDLEWAQAAELCMAGGDPPPGSEGRRWRVVSIGEAACMCGGTHLATAGEIGGMTVTKVQSKGKNTRVYYSLADAAAGAVPDATAARTGEATAEAK